MQFLSSTMAIEDVFPMDAAYSVEKTVQDPVSVVARRYLDEFFSDDDDRKIAWAFYNKKIFWKWTSRVEEPLHSGEFYPEEPFDEVYLQLCAEGVQSIGIVKTENGTEIGQYDFCKDINHVEL